MCQHVSLVRRLLPPKEINSPPFFLFTESTNIIFPRTGGKEKKRVIMSVHYIPFQPASHSFSPPTPF